MTKLFKASEKYLVCNTTKEHREEQSISALGYSVIESQEPTDEVKGLVDQYIEGKVEIGSILEETIKRYKR